MDQRTAGLFWEVKVRVTVTVSENHIVAEVCASPSVVFFPIHLSSVLSDAFKHC